jgi:thioredoxin reductase (NADPH)
VFAFYCVGCCREQSIEYGCKIFTETVNSVDLQHGSPFTLLTDTKVVQADSLIIATGAAAKRLKIPGADEATGFWNKGISACAVCDGSSPLFRCVQLASHKKHQQRRQQQVGPA